MNFKRFFLICSAAALLVALPSCNDDDDETTTSNYLDGSLSFNLPEYVLGKEEFTLIPTGVTNPTGDLGYYWKNSWDGTKDTTKLEAGSGDGRYTFTTPEKIGKYSVGCVAFADGYYTTSATDTIFVVDPKPNTTITDASLSYDDPHFTDLRDGKTYFTMTYGGLTWTKNNLGYDGSGASYLSSTAMDELFGRFYTWAEAQTACPDGWHLPTDTEFSTLANSLASEGTSFKKGEIFKGIAGDIMVNAKFLGTRMWEFWPSVNISNKSGFAALPVGYAVDQTVRNVFSGLNSYAAFWTSDSDGDNGCYRYVYVDKPDVFTGLGDKESFRASVRCVKD